MDGQLTKEQLALLRAGDHAAFNAFVRAQHGVVYRLSWRLLRHAHDAQEVTQEAFLAAFEGIAGFEGRASPRSWLLAIAYRKAMDRLRRRIGESNVLTSLLDDDALWKIAQRVEHLTDWGANPEQHMVTSQVREHLDAALARLTPETRSVFELRDLQGLTSQETADVLGISDGAVRVRLHRVRQYLMAELQSLLGERGVRP